MADEDKDSRTEEPTWRRRHDAFRKGKFAQAPEVAVSASLLVGLLLLWFAIPDIARRLSVLGAFLFGHLGQFEISRSSMQFWMQEGVVAVGGLLFPILGAAMLAGVLAGGMQSKFRLTMDALDFNWARLNVISGFKRLVSKDVLVRLGIDLLKLGAISAVIWLALRRVLEDPIFYTPVNVAHLGDFIHRTSIFVFLRIFAASAIIAVIAYVYQRRKTTKDLMMTKAEVKRERKNAEVKPEVRRAQRALARRILQRQMLKAVPTADVVVTNPTHFAVALKYERGLDRAPVVLAKGHNLLARRIKAIALEHSVPMVENKPVARALFKFGQVGKEIPAQLYQAVAEILGFVHRTHRYYFHRLKARRLGATLA
jgi:flagellar biosynthetic protein FlhB